MIDILLSTMTTFVAIMGVVIFLATIIWIIPATIDLIFSIFRK